MYTRTLAAQALDHRLRLPSACAGPTPAQPCLRTHPHASPRVLVRHGALTPHLRAAQPHAHITVFPRPSPSHTHGEPHPRRTPRPLHQPPHHPLPPSAHVQAKPDARDPELRHAQLVPTSLSPRRLLPVLPRLQRPHQPRRTHHARPARLPMPRHAAPPSTPAPPSAHEHPPITVRRPGAAHACARGRRARRPPEPTPAALTHRRWPPARTARAPQPMAALRRRQSPALTRQASDRLDHVDAATVVIALRLAEPPQVPALMRQATIPSPPTHHKPNPRRALSHSVDPHPRRHPDPRPKVLHHLRAVASLTIVVPLTVCQQAIVPQRRCACEKLSLNPAAQAAPSQAEAAPVGQAPSALHILTLHLIQAVTRAHAARHARRHVSVDRLPQVRLRDAVRDLVVHHPRMPRHPHKHHQPQRSTQRAHRLYHRPAVPRLSQRRVTRTPDGLDDVEYRTTVAHHEHALARRIIGARDDRLQVAQYGVRLRVVVVPILRQRPTPHARPKATQPPLLCRQRLPPARRRRHVRLRQDAFIHAVGDALALHPAVAAWVLRRAVNARRPREAVTVVQRQAHVM